MSEIYGTNGRDTLIGTADRDIISPLAGPDTVYAGAGDDQILGEFAINYPSLPRTPESENSNDRLFGQGGNDRIEGEHGDDYIDGGSGNDHLNGGGLGVDGDDIIIGGTGIDQLYGDDGADRFYFGRHDSDTVDFGQADTIHDFNSDDTIYLQGNYTYSGNTSTPAEGQYSVWQLGGDHVVTWRVTGEATYHDVVVMGDDPTGHVSNYFSLPIEFASHHVDFPFVG